METLELFFILLLCIVFYTYLGYGILLFLMISFKRLIRKKQTVKNSLKYQPNVTLLIPAYNEEKYVLQKIKNCKQINYPKNKINFIWVTDGSNDTTTELLQQHKHITLFHEAERKGKINAIHRVMPFITSSIVIFSDANTLINKEAITRIIKCFEDPKVGCVSGEKRIIEKESDAAAGSGEGMYWKYESLLKKWDAELYSVVGAAGELFAIRTALYESVPSDTILDDFMISLKIADTTYTSKL